MRMNLLWISSVLLEITKNVLLKENLQTGIWFDIVSRTTTQLTNSDTLLYNYCNNTYDRAWIGMREGLIGVSYLSGLLVPF